MPMIPMLPTGQSLIAWATDGGETGLKGVMGTAATEAVRHRVTLRGSMLQQHGFRNGCRGRTAVHRAIGAEEVNGRQPMERTTRKVTPTSRRRAGFVQWWWFRHPKSGNRSLTKHATGRGRMANADVQRANIGMVRVGSIDRQRGVEVDCANDINIGEARHGTAVAVGAGDRVSGCERLMGLARLRRFGPISRTVLSTTVGGTTTCWRI